MALITPCRCLLGRKRGSGFAFACRIAFVLMSVVVPPVSVIAAVWDDALECKQVLTDPAGVPLCLLSVGVRRAR